MLYHTLVRENARPRKTVDDFMSLPEGTRAELIDGELFMSPSPQTPHQLISMNLATLLANFVHGRQLGRVFAAPYDVHLPSGDIVEPDILFIAKANLKIVENWVRGVPDLVIEIISPDGADRDRVTKHGLYARNRVNEYWIVDPSAKTVDVFTLLGDRYEPTGHLEQGESIRSPLLSGLEIHLEDVFQGLDE